MGIEPTTHLLGNMESTLFSDKKLVKIQRLLVTTQKASRRAC